LRSELDAENPQANKQGIVERRQERSRGRLGSASARETMAPMKLYGAVLSWNVTRCATALEEAGSDYEIVPINFATAEHKSPEHLARNVPYSSRSLSRFCCFFFPAMEMHRSVPFACWWRRCGRVRGRSDFPLALSRPYGCHFTGDRGF
jgi:hypothetical protein